MLVCLVTAVTTANRISQDFSAKTFIYQSDSSVASFHSMEQFFFLLSYFSFSLDTRESSYLNAIAAAGVAYQITKGCSLGDWDVCNCASQPQKRGQKAGEASWEWGGCSEDFGFGSRYSKEFMDPDKNPEKDLSKFITQHNNEAGRKVCLEYQFFGGEGGEVGEEGVVERD